MTIINRSAAGNAPNAASRHSALLSSEASLKFSYIKGIARSARMRRAILEGLAKIKSDATAQAALKEASQ